MFHIASLLVGFSLFVALLGDTEKKLFVIIPSYNNAKWAEKNLSTLLLQKYTNFEGIYIDDCSLDLTGTTVRNMLQTHDPLGKIEYVRNTQRRGKAANLWLALHGFLSKKKIQDQDIVVILDGDDWYPHDTVFSFLNKFYVTNDIWLTYGGFVREPRQKSSPFVNVPAYVIDKNLFRYFGGCGSQQRTFYAWLYRKIKLSDFFFEGKFMPCTSDLAKIIPMMEMAGSRFRRIDEIIYVYNRANTINDDKNGCLQAVVDRYIRAYTKIPISLKL